MENPLEAVRGVVPCTSEPYKPWSKHPRSVKGLDAQAASRLVDRFVNELCWEIDDLVSNLKSLPPGKQRARVQGEYEALTAVLQRMEDHGLVAPAPKDEAGGLS